MQTIHSLSSLLEQAVKGVSFKIVNTKVSPRPFVTVQWQYEYRWPKSDPTLGTSDEIAKFINASTDKDPALIMSTVNKSPDGSTFGIARDPGNTANARLFRSDQLIAIGYVYVFVKDKIDINKIPTDMKVGEGGKVGKLVAFDTTDLAKYMATPGTATKATSVNTAPVKITSADFSQIGAKYTTWFNTFVSPYYREVFNKMSTTQVFIEQSGELPQIFWQTLKLMPAPFAITAPAAKDLNTFTRDLQTSLRSIFKEAQSYDPNNFGETIAAVDVLSRETWTNLVKAIIVIGLNTGKISKESVTKGALPAEYAELFKQAGKTAASAIPNDVTEIGDGDALARIISGAAAIGKYSTDLTTADLAKTFFNTLTPKFKITFDQIVAKLPIIQKTQTNTKIAEFTSFRTAIAALANSPKLIQDSVDWDNNTTKLFTESTKKSVIPKNETN